MIHLNQEWSRNAGFVPPELPQYFFNSFIFTAAIIDSGVIAGVAVDFLQALFMGDGRRVPERLKSVIDIPLA